MLNHLTNLQILTRLRECDFAVSNIASGPFFAFEHHTFLLSTVYTLYAILTDDHGVIVFFSFFFSKQMLEVL